MASSLCRTVRGIPSQSSLAPLIAQSLAQSPSQYRSFSQSSQLWARRNVNIKPAGRGMAQPSLKLRQKEASDIHLKSLNDVGLLPGTFVRPKWTELPSIFRDPGDRLLLEWTWVKAVVTNAIALFIQRKITQPRPINIRQRRHIARMLYTDMYTALALGDVSALKRLTCDSLRDNLTAQIASRPRNQAFDWQLIKWRRTPSTNFTGAKVVMDRCVPAEEIGKDSSIRQVILRMTSRQAIAKGFMSNAGEFEPAEPAVVQDCEEYIVIQEFFRRGHNEGWKIWGYVKPTDIEQIRSDPAFSSERSAGEIWQQIKEIFTSR